MRLLLALLVLHARALGCLLLLDRRREPGLRDEELCRGRALVVAGQSQP